MPKSLQINLPPMGATSIDSRDSARSIAVDQALGYLRQAIADRGYTLDALEAAMGKDRAHIHRVLQGEKPMTLAFLTALPDDVESLYHQKCAESFGAIVVTPSTGEHAARDFVSGLLGLINARKIA